MSWNHRILAHEQNGEFYFQIHNVHYTNDIPDGCGELPVPIGSETLKGIQWTLNRMQEALKKPVLWAGEKFPQECKIKYICDRCGRDNFDKPTSHNCTTGFRKRGLTWTIKCE
jgi:hypothetical protein